ncbi:hypothetical protein Tco_0835994 [Tanacetum coccineum]
MSGNHQKVPVDYFFNNDLKYLQGGVSTMTYTTSITKTKAVQYDLPSIKDMVPKIWVPVKVAYDKHALWGISHWREQRKTFYGYAQGLQSTHDVYSTKHILAVTQVEVMRKHGYGYLQEIMNQLTNLSGDDVSDFAIALRMFTRSLVIQKRVEDLQLGVKSYQNKINVTKPETTKSGIRKRDPYTPYQDPQGFIYIDNNGRNRLLRSDELYKFSDRTLTRLRTSLDDIMICVQILQKSQENGQKTGKHEHGNGRARKKPGGSYQKLAQHVTSRIATLAIRVRQSNPTVCEMDPMIEK